MFSDENAYSQLVGFLKIALPLGALALMSTVFLFARAPTPESAIPYAEIEAIAQEPRLAGAQLTGIADDGSKFSLSARTARPQGDVLSAEGVFASIESADGTITEISAGSGTLDQTDRSAYLDGLARIQTSNGFEMETNGVAADLTTGRIETDGPLEVQAPFGTVTAGQLVIETPDGAPGQVMIFQNGVRLVYTPQK